jgi:hypothetical protein
LPPASLPAAASIPISARSSLTHRAGAAASQASGTSTASKPTAVKASTPGETESTDESSGDSTPESAFAEIIRQLSSEASAPALQSVAGSANQRLFRGWPATGSGSRPLPARTAAVPAALAAPVTEKKQPTSTPRLAETPLVAAKDHTQDVRPVPIDVVTPFVPVKPKLAELTDGGAVSEADLKPRAVRAEPLQPEAALTVVIRNDDPPAPAATSSDDGAASASAPPDSTVSIANAAQVAGYEVVTAPGATSPGSDTEHRTASGGTAAVDPDASAVKSAGPQTAAFQDLQLKSEPVKNDSPGPRAAAQTAPEAPPERVAPEKSPAPPVKSVALEFTPDGTRDVKVRLSERGGEVHVSVHSTDPTVTRSLRAGVTDLASVLERAGYDAKAWAGERQQQGNPQQQQQQTPQRRNDKSSDGEQQFESILQQPNQENS